MSKEIKCCISCGRDTTANSGYCLKCTGYTPSPAYSLDVSRNKILYDDYSEDSDADSCIKDKSYVVHRDDDGRYRHSQTD